MQNSTFILYSLLYPLQFPHCPASIMPSSPSAQVPDGVTHLGRLLGILLAAGRLSCQCAGVGSNHTKQVVPHLPQSDVWG